LAKNEESSRVSLADPPVSLDHFSNGQVTFRCEREIRKQQHGLRYPGVIELTYESVCLMILMLLSYRVTELVDTSINSRRKEFRGNVSRCARDEVSGDEVRRGHVAMRVDNGADVAPGVTHLRRR
jgi:hypothetical protein